ncbi:MAG: aminotransferase class V-fold PLP-dependent enzyme [Bacteroidales bacterium]|nr:aminotransferase class V-fold PLP-dependent enzyme [Bacteroidales bacterium]
MNIDIVRKYFPVCKKYHYFQSAGLSPLPEFILQKYILNYTQLANEGDFQWQTDILKLQETYQYLAKLLHTDAENIVFVENNSLAMSLLGLSFLNKHKGFNIVSLEEEFPSNTVPFEYLNIEMRYVPHLNHRYTISSILEHCDKQTLAVICSYVQYSTGFRLDIQTLGNKLKERNILFIVNATQAFPLFPINIKECNIDVLTCSVHKWGFCGHIGTLFITTSNFRRKYPTPIAGWFSVNTNQHNDIIYTKKNCTFNVWDTAQQYQFGSYNIKNRILLKEMLEFIENIGYNNIYSHIIYCTTLLIERFKKMGIPIISPINNENERSCILSFTLGTENNAKLIKYLENKNIIVALRNNFVRISVNIFNNETDIEALCNGIQSFLKSEAKAFI